METAVAEKKPKVIHKQITKVMPYLDGKSDNGGMAKYGHVLFEGGESTFYLGCLQNGGMTRWLTGLDEFAPEVQKIEDEDTREARIRTIRERICFLERTVGANNIEVDDKDFWSKVKTFRPDNHDYWKQIHIKTSNEPIFLDPQDAAHLILISAIEAGSFPDIAKSLEDARSAAVSPKWYLDREAETYSTKTEIKKIKNEAIAALSSLADKGGKYMMYVVKNIDPRSDRYKYDTSSDVIYDYLDSYISGQGHEKSIKRASQHFMSIQKMPMEELRIKATIADALFYKYIIQKPDGMLYTSSTNIMLGRNMTDALFHLNEAKNAKTWEELFAEVEANWKI